MRKRIAIIMLVLTALSVAALVAYRYMAAQRVSGEAPVISFDSKTLEVMTDATMPELLQGVTATDAEDGDVTDSLLVEASTNFVSDTTVEVTYAAFDSNGHVSKATRNVRYVDYRPPEIYFTGPMVFSESSVSELLTYVGARDCIDGDISMRVKASSLESGTLLSNPGEHVLEFRVTNSVGDTAYLTCTVEVLSGYSTSQQIPLKDYLVYLPVGSEFDPRSYLTDEYTEERTLEIENEVDTSTPGSYDVYYTLGNRYTRLIVIVEGEG